MAWGIDLPSGGVVNRLLSERFWRGYLTYIAGAKTLRFRLSPAMTAASWQGVVDALRIHLAELVEQVGWDGPEAFAEAVAALPPGQWKASGVASPARFGLAAGYRLEPLSGALLEAQMARILELEAEAYEPERRETEAGLSLMSKVISLCSRWALRSRALSRWMGAAPTPHGATAAACTRLRCWSPRGTAAPGSAARSRRLRSTPPTMQGTALSAVETE